MLFDFPTLQNNTIIILKVEVNEEIIRFRIKGQIWKCIYVCFGVQVHVKNMGQVNSIDSKHSMCSNFRSSPQARCSADYAVNGVTLNLCFNEHYFALSLSFVNKQ